MKTFHRQDSKDAKPSASVGRAEVAGLFDHALPALLILFASQLAGGCAAGSAGANVSGDQQTQLAGVADPSPGRLAMSEPLKACPDSPNCVCSEYTGGTHEISPLSFSDDSSTAWARAKAAVENLSRTVIVEVGPDYLHAESRSLLFRFVDDLEMRLDADAGVIHLRSASRTGYGDMGVNRRRVEQLREAFNALQGDAQ